MNLILIRNQRGRKDKETKAEVQAVKVRGYTGLLFTGGAPSLLSDEIVKAINGSKKPG